MVFLRQEWKEVIHSKMLWLASLIYAVFFIIFILVGTRESTIMGFTGITRVLFSWSHGLVFFLPLLAMTTTTTTVIQYRENGGLEFFLSQPVSRGVFFLALTVSRFMALILPLIVILVITFVIGMFSESIYRFDYGINFFFISFSLLWCFLSLGLYLSEKNRSQVRAIVLMILIWMIAVILIDIFLVGLILQFSPSSPLVFFLTELNPVQAARLALLIELDLNLSTLGPVGFFVAHRLGSTSVFFIGFLWPLILGTFFWLLAKQNFDRSDLI